jgi:hypothetical protein
MRILNEKGLWGLASKHQLLSALLAFGILLTFTGLWITYSTIKEGFEFPDVFYFAIILIVIGILVTIFANKLIRSENKLDLKVPKLLDEKNKSSIITDGKDRFLF